MLGIKAKETQLVRARSDAESAEERAASLEREVERLKREVGRLGRHERESAHIDSYSEHGSNGMNGMRYDTGSSNYDSHGRPAYAGPKSYHRSNLSYTSRERERASSSEGKENTPDDTATSTQELPERRKLSPSYGMTPSRTGSNLASREHSSNGGRDSPQQRPGSGQESSAGGANGAEKRGAPASRIPGDGVESWRRAAEVTQNLKARIEMMKVCLSAIADVWNLLFC